MEENQMPKKRNYERYLESQNMTSSQESAYSAPGGSEDAWTQDPFAAYETPASQPVYTEPAYAEPSYSEPSNTASEFSQNSYSSSYQQPVAPQNYGGLEEPVSKGEWALCYFLMMIPCVGLIMMFVWAFSKTEKQSKSNFFKVQLIFMGVIFVLYLLLFLFALGMGVAMGS